MKDEDIIGKKFTCFEFPNHALLKYKEDCKHRLGLLAVVLNLHDKHPEYANSRVTLKNGKTQDCHYPTAMIKQQIEENEKPIDLDVLFEQIKNI